MPKDKYDLSGVVGYQMTISGWIRKRIDSATCRAKDYGTLEAGRTGISGGILQILYGVHFGVLILTLMLAADSRTGGVGGISWGLVTVGVIVAILYSALMARWASSIWRKVAASGLSGLLFFDVIGLGLRFSVFEFGFKEGSTTRPIFIAATIYSGITALVFLRLQRRVSPSRSYYGLPKDKTEIHLKTNWRIFQGMLSLLVALVVGVIFPVGLAITRRQGIIVQPLGWYLLGVFSVFIVLGAQLLYEMSFLEEAYSG